MKRVLGVGVLLVVLGAFYGWYSGRIRFECSSEGQSVRLRGVLALPKTEEIHKSAKTHGLIFLHLSPELLQKNFGSMTLSTWPQLLEAELSRPEGDLEILLQLEEKDVVDRGKSPDFQLVSAAIIPGDPFGSEIFVRAFSTSRADVRMTVRQAGLDCKFY
jgi:hypothetical protein